MKSSTCLCCGASLSAQAARCRKCGVTVFEYSELKDIRINGGTIRYLASYETDRYKLNKLVNEYAQKIKNFFVLEYIPANSYKNIDIPKAMQKIVISNICRRMDAFFDAVGDHSEVISDFFMERGFYSLFPLHDLAKELPPSSSIFFYYNSFEQECCRIMEDHSNQIGALSMELEKTTAHYSSQPSSPVIVANSWTAVAMNEIGLARDRATTKEWKEHSDSIQYRVMLVTNQTVAEVERALLQFIQNIKQFIFDRFKEQSLRIEGAAASEVEWLNILKAPECSENYVPLLSNSQFSDGISDLVKVFGINKDELYTKCCDSLNQKLGVKTINGLIDEEKNLISNMTVLFSKSKSDIIRDFLKQYSDKVVSAISDIYHKLPEKIKSNLPPKKQALGEAQALLNSIICPENYLFMNSVFGLEWQRKIGTECNLDTSSESPYEQILKSIFRRICIANDYATEKNTALSKLNEEQRILENALKNKGFFAFSEKKQLKKQMIDVEQKIEKQKEDYEKKLKAL